jgi:catechol 2,3-dioxygenase-like lactoylglutathione lyase family enzyme
VVAGIEHVGITVPEIQSAVTFLHEALGAEMLYEHWTRDSEPFGGAEAEKLLGVAPGAAIVRACMLHMADGPDIELFEYSCRDQAAASRPSDFGLQHISFATDDILSACDRVIAAGGEVLAGPREFPIGAEAGEGNKWCYARTPWGMTIELTMIPSAQGYESQTHKRRYKPGQES